MLSLPTEAICRVALVIDAAPGKAPPRERRGTGFLVTSDGLVITARHVVWDDKNQREHPGKLRLTFDTPGAAPHATDAKIVYRDEKLDFAMLQATDPPKTGPLPLGRGDRAITNPTYWSSFGYTQSSPVSGSVYSGTLARAGLRFQLTAIQGLGVGALSVEGLSGGPCIVHGEVVALITSELSDPGTGTLVEGKLYALPLESVDAALKEAAAANPALATPEVPLGPKVEVPYLGAFRNELVKLDVAKLAEVGRALDLEDLDDLEAPALIVRIVRALFEQGVDGAMNIVTAHHDVLHAQEKKWPELAETFWVSPAAVNRILGRASPAGGPVALLAGHPEIVRHCLRRALHARLGTIDGLSLNVVEVGPLGADVELSIRTALRDHFKSDGDKLVKNIARKKLVFVVVEGPLPSPDALNTIRGEMPELCFVVVQEQSGGIDKAIEMVRPTPGLDAQKELMTRLEDAREALKEDLAKIHEEGG